MYIKINGMDLLISLHDMNFVGGRN